MDIPITSRFRTARDRDSHAGNTTKRPKTEITRFYVMLIVASDPFCDAGNRARWGKIA